MQEKEQGEDILVKYCNINFDKVRYGFIYKLEFGIDWYSVQMYWLIVKWEICV